MFSFLFHPSSPRSYPYSKQVRRWRLNGHLVPSHRCTSREQLNFHKTEKSVKALEKIEKKNFPNYG